MKTASGGRNADFTDVADQDKASSNLKKGGEKFVAPIKALVPEVYILVGIS
jgi:hypothetical protein